MLKCREVTRLYSESRDRPLTLRERLSLRIHVLWCDGCRNFGKQMRFLSDAMHHFARGDRDKDRD